MYISGSLLLFLFVVDGDKSLDISIQTVAYEFRMSYLNDQILHLALEQFPSRFSPTRNCSPNLFGISVVWWQGLGF